LRLSPPVYLFLAIGEPPFLPVRLCLLATLGLAMKIV
jgi:hypothetical protein